MKKDIIETEIVVQENRIRVMRVGDTDYISLTDLSRYVNEANPANVIIHWMSSKNTFNYIGLWEQLNNENFNFTEFREIKNNELYINNTLYEEDYLPDDLVYPDFSLSDLGYSVIPDDMYLVLGDNREDSLDSREIGLIKKEEINGKIIFRLWPINKISIF